MADVLLSGPFTDEQKARINGVLERFPAEWIYGQNPLREIRWEDRGHMFIDARNGSGVYDAFNRRILLHPIIWTGGRPEHIVAHEITHHCDIYPDMVPRETELLDRATAYGRLGSHFTKDQLEFWSYKDRGNWNGWRDFVEGTAEIGGYMFGGEAWVLYRRDPEVFHVAVDAFGVRPEWTSRKPLFTWQAGVEGYHPGASIDSVVRSTGWESFGFWDERAGQWVLINHFVAIKGGIRPRLKALFTRFGIWGRIVPEGAVCFRNVPLPRS